MKLTTKLISASVVFLTLSFTALIGVIGYQRAHSKQPAAAVNSFSQSSSIGFWKDIQVTEDDKDVSAPAFFCSNDGSYQGHITNSDHGWWVVHKSNDKRGSYVNEEFAKKRVENEADCK